MKKAIRYILFIILVVFASCENREWDNPFDPDCPKELFTPANFTAKQEGNLVKLTWTQSNTQISGFEIERSIDGGATWLSVATTSKTELTWSDPNINGGKEHKYRLVAKAGSNRSNEVTTQVTPVFAPTLTTLAVTNSTANSASSGGNITSDGGTAIAARGVCWSTSQNPTTSDSKTTDGIGTGSFTSNITGLTANTTYYVRAYATNSQGTAYGAHESFTTPSTSAQTVTDIEGNVYKTVTIGTQIWMAENLKTTKYNDGTIMPNVTADETWATLTSGAYCWYDNNINNKAIYGALYNWYTVNTDKLCPIGWHVPSDAEWSILENFLSGSNIAGGNMKSITGWDSPNTGATNSSGFTALPGGDRGYGGGFKDVGSYGYWWSSTEDNTVTAGNRGLANLYSNVFRHYGGKEYGFVLAPDKLEKIFAGV